MRTCVHVSVCLCACVNKECVVHLSTVEVTVSRGAGHILPTGPQRERDRAPRPQSPRMLSQAKLCEYSLLRHNSYMFMSPHTSLERVEKCLFLCRAKAPKGQDCHVKCDENYKAFDC